MAGMKKVVVLNVAVLALVLAMSAASADMVDFFKLLNSKNQEFAVKRPDVRPCCDNCKCTKSIPPQCTCTDVFIGTKRCKHCKKCVCTLSMPPQCRCADVKDFCYPPCAYATAAEATLEIIQKVTA